jgi:zinc transport system substrate-binding protein
MPQHTRIAALAGLALVGAALAACGDATSTSVSGDTAQDQLKVVAAFYPLQYTVERVGGDRVAVEGLTPAGVDPHDVELSPQQVVELSESDLVVYLKGFQPAVDEAVEQSGVRAIDIGADLEQPSGPLDGEDQGSGPMDPHIWLDPLKMVDMSQRVRGELSSVDPAHATDYTNRATALDGELRALDKEWQQRTKTCESRDLVVSHEAFRYLADRYDFRQVPITGISPEAEPDPSQIARITDFVRNNSVTTIYYETLVDPKVAKTVAAETGAATAVLDPIEGLEPGSNGDYQSISRTNLDTVVTGQRCT